MARFAIAVPVNREGIFVQCLAASPEVKSGAIALKAYRDWPAFGPMANAALAESDADWLILAHQDAYLPAGFARRIESAIDWLEANAPDVGVFGAVGLGADGLLAGHIWSSGLSRELGLAAAKPTKATALDEVVLVIRRSAALSFDEAMPGFHLYGTDIVHAAKRAGLSAWVADLPIVHHSHAVVRLDRHYRAAWRYLRGKWRADLPLANLVCPVEPSIWPLVKRDLRLRIKARGRISRPAPRGDPATIASELGWVEPDLVRRARGRAKRSATFTMT